MAGYGTELYGVDPYGSSDQVVQGAAAAFYAPNSDGTIDTTTELVSVDSILMGNEYAPITVRKRSYRMFFIKNVGTAYLRNAKIQKVASTDPNAYVSYAENLAGGTIPNDGDTNVTAGAGPGTFTAADQVELGDIAPGGAKGVWIKREIYTTVGISSNTIEMPKFNISADVEV